MDDGILALLQESAIELIKKCKDEGLLDLVCKLFLEVGTAAECEGENVSIIP